MMRFRLADWDFVHSPTGRALYIHQPMTSNERTLYLYHRIINPKEGTARWIVTDDIDNRDAALAFVDSWAAAPHMISSASDGEMVRWQTFQRFDDEGGSARWAHESKFDIFCEGEDTTVFFDAPSDPHLTGMYVQHHVPAKLPPGVTYAAPLFVRISEVDIPLPSEQHEDSPRHMFLFRGEGKWIVGDTFGVEHGLAFVPDDVASPFDMRHDAWYFSIGEGAWAERFARIYSSRTEVDWGDNANVFAYADTLLFVRALRSLKHIPLGQRYQLLRNGVPMPLFGLGTGGLGSGPDALTATANALHLGYGIPASPSLPPPPPPHPPPSP